MDEKLFLFFAVTGLIVFYYFNCIGVWFMIAFGREKHWFLGVKWCEVNTLNNSCHKG